MNMHRILLFTLALLYSALAYAQPTGKTFSSLSTMTSVDGSTWFCILDGTPKVWKKFQGSTLRSYVNTTVTSIANGSALSGISAPYEGDLAINTAKDTLWVRDDAAWIVFKAGTSGSTPNLQNVLTTGNSANSTRITNLGTPIGSADAATKGYIDTQLSTAVDAANVYAANVSNLARDTAIARSNRALRDSLARTGWITENDLANNSVNSNQIKTNAVSADEIASSGVTAGSYGSSSAVPIVTVDQDGRITGMSTVSDTIRILGIGQSNMIGRPDTSVTKSVAWDSTKNNSVLVFNLEINRWQIADKLNCHGTWGNLYGGVPVNNAVWQFAKELQRRTGAVIKYVISARGGRSLSYWTGGTYPMTGEGKDSLIAQVARSGIGKFDVVIWDQGESDIANSSYETQFRNFFLKDIRNRSWFDSYKPVIITGMPVTNANYIPFNERLIKLTDLSDPYLTIAQTDSLALVTNDPFSPGDNVHFTGVSLQRLGARYFNAFINTPKSAKSGLYDLAWRDVLVNAKGNTLRLDSLDGVIDVAADKRFYIDKTEPGWAGRFEPYQYLEYTANGDPRFEMRSFSGDNLDSPGNISQSNFSPRLGSINFRGYQGGWRRGASIASFPDSVQTNIVYGSLRFNIGGNITGFGASESYISMTSRGTVIGNGVLNTDSDAILQLDGTNSAVSGRYWNGSSRVYSKFKNTIFGIQDASVYSLVHNPFVDSTFFKGNVRIQNTNTQVRFGKSEYPGNGNLETSIDASSRYDATWASRFVVNPYGYLDLINVQSAGDNPRFYFYNSRGTSESAKVRSNVNDYVGFINFAPYNGTAYHVGAVIGTTIAANSAGTSGTRFSQMMFFGIDKGGNSPQISSNWVLSLDSIRAYVPKNFQAGGLLNGTTANLFVNSTSGGNVGVGTVSPTSKLHIAGSFSNMVTTISSATTLGEHTVVFATGASTYLVTLPAASTCVGRRYMVKVNGGAKTISSYLDLTGSASTTLANNSVLNLISDGTNWQQL